MGGLVEKLGRSYNNSQQENVKIKNESSHELLKAIGYIALWAALLQLFKLPAFVALRNSGTDARSEVFMQLYPLAALIVVTLLFMFVIDRRKIIPRITHSPGRDCSMGLVIGSLLSGGTVGLFLMTDSITFRSWSAVDNALLWTLAIVLNVITQEYVLRGYLFLLIQTRFGPIAAVAVSSALFALFSPYVFPGGTLPILIAFAFNILLSLLRIHTSGMLTPFLVHLIWSIMGILILGVIPNGDGYPSFASNAIAGIAIFTGGSNRFAGSALTFIIIVTLIDLAVILITDARERALRSRRSSQGWE
jgi:membrane protease YdiL (CAAX protease family)